MDWDSFLRQRGGYSAMVDVCFKISNIIVILRCYDGNACVIGLFFWVVDAIEIL